MLVCENFTPVLPEVDFAATPNKVNNVLRHYALTFSTARRGRGTVRSQYSTLLRTVILSEAKDLLTLEPFRTEMGSGAITMPRSDLPIADSPSQPMPICAPAANL